MSPKLQLLKESIDKVLNSETFASYEQKKLKLAQDSKYQMYKYIINNKPKFSANVYNRAKLKYVNSEQILKEDRKQLDEVFNKLISLYDNYEE